MVNFITSVRRGWLGSFGLGIRLQKSKKLVDFVRVIKSSKTQSNLHDLLMTHLHYMTHMTHLLTYIETELIVHIEVHNQYHNVFHHF